MCFGASTISGSIAEVCDCRFMADEIIDAQANPGKVPVRGVFGEQINYRLIMWIAVGLGVVTFAVYFRTLHNGFISYDDPDYITNNALVRQGLSWRGIAQAFKTFDQGNWFPLEWISLMSTSAVFGLNPAAYHLTNLVLHIFNVILLFLLLRKATGKTARSAMVAALFALLPLNVEAVAWATERKSVLSVFFMLLALAAYGWYVRRSELGRYLAIVVSFAFGLMTKAWLVPFPFALLLLDYWPLQRFGRARSELQGQEDSRDGFGRLLVEKLPLIAMSLGTTIAAIFAARASGALSISTSRAPFALRFENALWSYLAYVLKGIWPSRLAIIYPFPQHFYPAWKIACASLFLLGVTGLVWRLRQKRYLIVGWLWYLGVLFPVIGLIQTGTQSMADRWAYVSFWGVFVAAVWAIADFAEGVNLPRAATVTAAGTILLLYACGSYVQIGYWHDSIALYSHALEVTRANGPVRVNLGMQYEEAGHPDLAYEQYQQTVVEMPNLGIGHYNLARLLAGQHRLVEATAEYRLAIANTGVPREIADAYVGLGAAYVEMNLPAKAIEQFNRALEANPNAVYALLDRGMLEFRQGDLESARRDFSRSTQILPTAMTWYTLGLILERQGNSKAAIQAFEAALHMNPNLVDAKTQLQTLVGKPGL